LYGVAAARRDCGPVDPLLGFLGGRRFALKTPENKGWILLDFLGFSRPNRAFSMGYAGFSADKISRALLPVQTAVEGMRMRRIAHDKSLAKFLIYVN
jgi:hypothetical protein